MKVNKLVVSSFAFVAIFVVSSNAHTSRAAPCTKTKAICVNMQEFDKYACECYCPYGRRGPSWGCDSNKFWDRTNCDCACNATQPAGGCGLGEWNKERCACYCPRPETPTPSGKTWARHPTCAYVCKNPKPTNLPAVKRWNDDKCRVECIPTKPDPIPAGKRWCEDCCELACDAQPPCRYTIPANKQWDTESCSMVCKDSPPNPISDKKQWNANICAFECKDPVPTNISAIKKWDPDTCSLVCRDLAPGNIDSNKQWNPETCNVECKTSAPTGLSSYKSWNTETCSLVCGLTDSNCTYPQILDSSACECVCSITDCPRYQVLDKAACDCLNVDRLNRNECLQTGYRLTSLNGCFYLDVTSTGLQLSRLDVPYWSKAFTDSNFVCADENGNFNVLDSAGLNIYDFDTKNADYLKILNGGELVLYGDGDSVMWQADAINYDQSCPF